MSEYDEVRVSKLVIKGEKRKKSLKSRKEKKKSKSETDYRNSEDSLRNGGWWCLNDFLSLTGQVCIELFPHCFLRALNNGKFVVGDLHNSGEGPDQEEIFTCIRAGDSQIAFKSGYNKYLAVSSDNKVIGVSDAVGERELFQPVFQDGKMALCASNGCFLAPSEEEGNKVCATSKKASLNEFIKIRANIDPAQIKKQAEADQIPEEERGSLTEAEEKYLKKFQSESTRNVGKLVGGKELKKARHEGNLHEALLDRRAKLKSDKFCK